MNSAGPRTSIGPRLLAWIRRRRSLLLASLAVASLALVGRILLQQDWAAAFAIARATEPRDLLTLATLVAASFLALTGYDFLALRLAGFPNPGTGRVIRASFVGFVFSMNLGFTALSGGAVRAFYYAQAGIPAAGIARILAHMAVTFFLGWLGLFGLTLLAHPLPSSLLPAAWASGLQQVAGVALLLGLVGYVAACAARLRPRLGRLAWTLPSLPLALVQVGVGVLDACVGGLVLYHVLPTTDVAFIPFMGAFLTAVFLGMASQVPGGLGVIEVALIGLLGGSLATEDVLAGMMLYRLVNFLLPLILAGGLFAWDTSRAARQTPPGDRRSPGGPRPA